MRSHSRRQTAGWKLGLITAASAFAVGCGGRTLPDTTDDVEDASAAFMTDVATSVAADAGPDPCPSAVIAGAGRPMPGNCSTRDGRSRVAGPASPHLTWTSHVPLGASGAAAFGSLAADASGSVYVSISLGSSTLADTPSDGSMLASFDGATGAMHWSATFATALSAAPLLLAGDVVDYFASDTSGATLFDRISVPTGAVTSSTFVPGLALPNPAVGADGAFYFVTAFVAVARLDPDAMTAWQTAMLLPNGGAASAIALATGDLVLVSIEPSGGASALLAIDPTTGTTRWAKTWPGLGLSGPVVRPDGSIAIFVGPALDAGSRANQSLVLLEPTGAIRSMVQLPDINAYAISAVAEDGSLLLAGVDPANQGLLVSLTGSGQVRWNSMAPAGFVGQATIDARGTVIVVGQDAIVGLDPATGSPVWTLAAVNATGIVDATLTRGGTIVVLETDGTLFGAGD